MIQKIKEYFGKFKIAKELELELLTKTTPEQYTVYYCGFAVAYIRLRNGVIKLFYTPNGELDESAFLIYYKDLKNRNLGNFEDKSQREKFLKICRKEVAKRLIFENIYDLSDFE